MADKPPLFPDATNMEGFRDFVDIQKQISEHLLNQKHLYEQIGRINTDVEQRVIKRRQAEYRTLLEIQNLQQQYQENEKKLVDAIGAERTFLDARLGSIKQEIKLKKDLIELSREANSMEIELAKKQHEEDTSKYKFAFSQMQKLLGVEFKQLTFVKSTAEEMIKLGNVSKEMAYTFGTVLMVLAGAFDIFKKFDVAAEKLRMSMGMTRANSEVIRKDASRIAVDYMGIGVTIEGVYKSYQALGKVVGGIHNVTKSMAEAVSIMAAQLGVSEEVSAVFLRNMAVISRSSMESRTDMMYVAQYMSAAAGVPLPQVMEDVSKATGQTLMLMSRMPNIALRTAIELRRMGTSINDAAKAGAHVLEFDQSIIEEMETSVLLGRSINIQRVRQLAYSRNLEESAKEILRLAKENGFATKMDYFQMRAFAQMTGYSVDQLLNMVQTSNQLEQIRRSGTPQQQKQLALYEQMRRENEATAKTMAKDVDAQLRQIGNQAQLVRLQNNWNKLLAQVQQIIFPVINGILGVINNHFTAIRNISIALGVIWTLNKMILLAQNRALIAQNLLQIKNALSARGMWLALSSGLTKYLPGIAALFSWLGGALFTLGMNIVGGLGGVIWPALTGIGETILAAITSSIGVAIAGILAAFAVGFGIGTLLNKFKFIQDAATAVMVFIMDGWRLVKTGAERVWNWIKEAAAGTWDDIVQGIREIGPQLWQTIVGAFNFAKKKIAGWLGFSPSSIGLSILRGISAVGSMIFDALTSPFRRGIAWIADKIPGMSKFANKIRGGVQGIVQPLERRATSAYIPAVTVTPNGTEIVPFKKNTAEGENKKDQVSLLMSEETGQKIVALLEKLYAKDTYVKMDGQLLSVHLARQTEHRGGYGVNKVA